MVAEYIDYVDNVQGLAWRTVDRYRAALTLYVEFCRDAGIASVDGFGEKDVELVEKALKAMAGAKAIVFDLRGNTGGYLRTALRAAGRIDGALVSRRLTAFTGRSVVATDRADLVEAAGSVYDQSFPLALLSRPLPAEIRSLALVATPCQVSVLRALQRYPWPYQRSGVGAVTLTIGLFCTRSFHPARLRRALRQRGLDPGRVRRVDVRDGRLDVILADGQRRPVGRAAELAEAGLPGCDECADFSGHLADLSVGNCGSPPGFTTVLVRTEAGEEAWREAAPALDAQPLLDLEPVAKEERRNRRRALRHLRRAYAPDGRLWVSYSEHVRAYAGSERAPTPPPAHRSHHYRIAC